MKIFDWILPSRRSFNSSGFPIINGGRKSIRQCQGNNNGDINTEEMKPLLSSENGMMIIDADVFENWKLDDILTIGTLAVESGLKLQKQEEMTQQEEEGWQETAGDQGKENKEVGMADDDDVVEIESTRPSCEVKMVHSSPASSKSRGDVMTCNIELAAEISYSSIEKYSPKLKGNITATEKKGTGRRVTLLDLFKAESHRHVVHELCENDDDDHQDEDNGSAAKTRAAMSADHVKKKTKASNSSSCKKPLLILSDKPDAAAADGGQKKSISSKAKKLFSRVKKLDKFMTRMSERKIHPSDMNEEGTKLEKIKGIQKNNNKYYELITVTTHDQLASLLPADEDIGLMV